MQGKSRSEKLIEGITENNKFRNWKGGRIRVREFIKGMAHIGIPTKELNKSVEFYEKLGFEVIHKCGEYEVETVAFVQLRNITLELYLTEDKSDMEGAIHHIALDVSDIEAAYREAERNGLKIITDGVVTLPYFWNKGTRYFMIEGYNHELIEFNQVL